MQKFKREIKNIQRTMTGVSSDVKDANREIAYIKECRNQYNSSP